MRQLLGMVLWDKASYGKKPKRPNEMTSAELDKFFQQRGVVRPDALDEAHGLAFAMLVVDGIIPQSEVPPTSPYDRLTLDALKEELKKRGLPVSGNKKDDCVRRLLLYDEAQELEKQHRRAKAAAEKERIEASIYVPPRPPPGPMGQDLREAQAAIAAIGKMDLPELRAALLARRLPVYGTREVLVERLMNILRKAVIDAHAGFRRLVNYAQAAVSKLSDEEVYEALAKRGLVSHSASQESTARLANSLVEDWIQMAMFPTPDGDNGWSDSPASDDDEGDEGASGLADPTLEVALVCGGATVDERSAALASARTSLPQLQSDLVWGTLLNDTIAAPMDDVPGNGEAPAQEPPRDAVSIDFITNPVPNGVVVSLSVPWAPPGCSFIVTATPVDGGQVVTAEGRTQDVLVLGLQPRTEYNFTARLRNAAGYGPESEPYYEATFVRHGVSVKVYYSVPVQTSAGEEWRYVQLSWKQVLAATAEELDARLGASLAAGGLGSSSLAELADTADVLVPLGLLPSEEEIQHQACATSWASQGEYTKQAQNKQCNTIFLSVLRS